MDDKNRNTIQQYVGDMLALEEHIEEAIDGQLKEADETTEAGRLFRRFHQMVRSQRDALKDHLKQIGGSESHPIKGAVASVFGKAAGAINLVRTKQVSKSLRDDYTAFNQAAIGYAMLHATASTLGDQGTAGVAERHLRAYAQAVQEIAQVIPSAVADELREEGLNVDPQAVTRTTETLNRVWRETGPAAAKQTSATTAGATSVS